VQLGFANSRMKDFFDLRFLARSFEFDGSLLSAAIAATFARRGTLRPASDESVASPAIVSVSTVVVRSGMARLRTLAVRMSMPNASSTTNRSGAPQIVARRHLALAPFVPNGHDGPGRGKDERAGAGLELAL